MRGSDTQSDVSESGTTNSGWTSSWDSREDLRDFATKIGLKDTTELYKDRFLVDRGQLEQMLSGMYAMLNRFDTINDFRKLIIFQCLALFTR